MKTVVEPTFRADIWVAGDLPTIRAVCREYTLTVGLCVTVEPCDFIFTGGMESGARIGLLNYPRFPKPPDAIRATARALAQLLLEKCCQTSALVVDDQETFWLSRRDENPKESTQ